jgi:superfamily I DNA and RNA helicase
MTPEYKRRANPTPEDIERARRMPTSEKFIAGARLFDEKVAKMTQEIRSEKPGISDEGILTIIRDRRDGEERREQPGE